MPLSTNTSHLLGILKHCFFVTKSFSIRLYIFSPFFIRVIFLLSWIAELWIRIHWSSISLIRIQSGYRVLMTKNVRKKIQIKIAISYQATGKHFSPEKRTSSISKNEIYEWVLFALLDPDPDCESGSTALLNWIRLSFWLWIPPQAKKAESSASSSSL